MGFDDEVALVTGGRGFAARHLVNQLIQKTEYHIRIMDLAPQMTLSEEELEGILGQAFADNRVAYVSADLTNRQQVFDGMDRLVCFLPLAYLGLLAGLTLPPEVV